MRIVHLNPFFFPYAGGSERRILELGRRHAKRHDVHVVTSQLPDTPATEVLDGIHVHRLPSHYWLRRLWNPPIVTTRGLKKVLRDLAPDILEFHYRWAPAYHRAYTSMKPRAGLGFTYHNTFGEGEGILRWLSLANDRWTRRFIRKSDAIFCISEYVRRDLAQRGFPKDRLIVAPNAVDGDALRDAATRGHVLPQVRGQTFIAGVGRLVDLKGYDDAIRAMPDLPKDTHLVLMGEGPDRKRLLALAQRLNVANRVHLPGWVDEADKMATVAAARALVHPTRHEAFGLAPLEALAVGTPVVATNVGGLPEVVGDAGTLVAPRDPKALAQALTPMLDRTPGPSGRARGQAAKFSWDTTARIHEAAYEAMQTSRGRP